MASALIGMAEWESLKMMAECPICCEVPRDGVMLQCLNGHNVCPACKSQLDVNKTRCPQGRCGYHDPPAKNKTVADLVASLPFEFACVFAKAEDANRSDCDFRGTNASLERHEVVCEHRPVACHFCSEFVSAGKFVEHLEAVHDVPVTRKEGSEADGAIEDIWFLWKEEYNGSNADSFIWDPSVYETSDGFIFPIVELQDGMVHVWLQMVAHSSVTDKLKCQITLSKADYSMSIATPVFPIDLTEEEIMKDDDCICLSAWTIRKLFLQDLPEDERKNGYTARFKVTFNIDKNAA